MTNDMNPTKVAPRISHRAFLASTAAALIFVCGVAAAPGSTTFVSGNRRLNNLATLLLEVVGAPTTKPFSFVRSSDGWIFISLTTHGEGTIRLTLDKASPGETPIHPAPGTGPTCEAMAHVTGGRHTLDIERSGTIAIEHLTLKAIPELMHCGLGFDPQIRSCGAYDLNFLKHDILPNVTTLIIPNSLKLSDSVIEDWHRQEKRFVAEVGINSQARTADEHATFWTSFFQKAPFFDGIIINEFIVNRPVAEWAALTPDRLARMDKERAEYELYSEAFKQIHADRIEGRFMGLGRPADPEHIGDTFLWMKRSEKGPNTFSQTIKNLQPGRLYSLKMLVCDYNDLITPKPKQIAETKPIFTVHVERADVDATRSFREVYASSPEPKIPVCITYHWEIFRAKAANATLTVSDWQSPRQPTPPFGQEQAFNFLEIQPYHE